jgi:hypothetical protein
MRACRELFKNTSMPNPVDFAQSVKENLLPTGYSVCLKATLFELI